MTRERLQGRWIRVNLEFSESSVLVSKLSAQSHIYWWQTTPCAPPPPLLQPSWLVTEFSLYVAHCSTMCGSAYSLERKPWKEEDTQSKVVLSKLFTCGQLLLHIRVDNVMEFGALCGRHVIRKAIWRISKLEIWNQLSLPCVAVSVLLVLKKNGERFREYSKIRQFDT